MAALAAALALALAGGDADQRCGECHPAIAESWRRHGMARTLERAGAEDLAALDGAVLRDPGSGYSYRIDAAGARGLLVEERAGPAGFAAHRRERAIVGFVGSGIHDRSLALQQGDRLWFAPVEWSTAKGLVLAPFQEMSFHARFGQGLTAECLGCHTDPPPEPRFPPERVADVPLRGIGCSGCHGSGEQHVASGGERGSITALGRLPEERQLDVCARCHLQGDARFDLAPPGAPALQPGDDLFLRRAAFVPERTDDEFGFVSAVERLALSPCFTASDRRLTCTVCHDPHRSATETETSHTDRACAGCHAPADCGRPGAPGAPLPPRGCAECHMRRSEPFDLRHVAVTDHFIRRLIPPPAPTGKLRVAHAADGAVRRFRWPGEEGRADAAEDRGALAMALVHLGQPARAIPLFAEALAGGVPGRLAKLPLFWLLRARAHEGVKDTAAAIAAYREALARCPDDPEAAINLGALLALAGDPAAAPLLQDVARRVPTAEQPWRNLAVLAARQGDGAGFVRALEEALARNPELAGLWLQLAQAQLRAGALAAALGALERARALDPDLPRLYTLIGIARFESGDRAGARTAFLEAARRDAGDADARAGLQRTGSAR